MRAHGDFSHIYRFVLLVGYLALSMLIPVGLVQAQADQEDTGHEQAYPGSTDLAMKEVSKQGKERY